MTIMNSFGCTSAEVIGKLTTGAYVPTAAELGGASVVTAAIDDAVTQIIQAMPEEVFKQLTQVDLQFLELRATEGQTAIPATTLKPLQSGKTYVWKGQPRYFKERPYKSTDLVPDSEFNDPSIYRPLSELTEGTDYTINTTTGVITFTSGLAKNDQVVASYMPNTDDAAYVIPSLKGVAADGAAYLLGSRLFSRESTQWRYIDTLQEEFTKKLEALQAKEWIPPELRLMTFWKEVEPAGGDNGARIKIGRVVRG